MDLYLFRRYQYEWGQGAKEAFQESAAEEVRIHAIASKISKRDSSWNSLPTVECECRLVIYYSIVIREKEERKRLDPNLAVTDVSYWRQIWANETKAGLMQIKVNWSIVRAFTMNVVALIMIYELLMTPHLRPVYTLIEITKRRRRHANDETYIVSSSQ